MLTRDNYQAAVLRLALELQACELGPGAVLRVSVAHDDWCAKWTGGRCDCDPVVSVRSVTPGGDAPLARRSVNGG